MNQSFHNLLAHEIQDLYDAEKQILHALPKMAEQAMSEKLKKGFEKHLEQTETHVERIEKVADELNIKLNGIVCKGMEGIIQEGKEIFDMDLDDNAKDAALITAAQKVEHYEIVGYASAIDHAKQIGHQSAVKVLVQTLDEEKKTDQELNTLAEKDINKKAAE